MTSESESGNPMDQQPGAGMETGRNTGMPMGQDEDDQGGMDNDGDELCVPLSALSMPGEDDAMEKPEVGDKGQANLEYTVTRIEGDNAYVKVDAVNGEKLEAEPAEPSEEQQFSELQDMAGQQPERY